MKLALTETNPVPSMAIMVNGDFELSLDEIDQSDLKIKCLIKAENYLLYIPHNLTKDGYDRIDAIVLSLCGLPYYHLAIRQGKTDYPEPIPPNNNVECEILLGYVRVGNGAVVIYNEDIQIIERFAEHG